MKIVLPRPHSPRPVGAREGAYSELRGNKRREGAASSSSGDAATLVRLRAANHRRDQPIETGFGVRRR